LSSHISAVILNAVKDPEALHSPRPFGPFNPPPSGRCICLFSSPQKSLVISTEAGHSLTVSSAAEKSASPPQPFATPNGAPAFVLVLNPQNRSLWMRPRTGMLLFLLKRGSLP
jgi:hypothetical protein